MRRWVRGMVMKLLMDERSKVRHGLRQSVTLYKQQMTTVIFYHGTLYNIQYLDFNACVISNLSSLI